MVLTQQTDDRQRQAFGKKPTIGHALLNFVGQVKNGMDQQIIFLRILRIQVEGVCMFLDGPFQDGWMDLDADRFTPWITRPPFVLALIA